MGHREERDLILWALNPDNKWAAIQLAQELFGKSQNDGIFNAACFSTACSALSCIQEALDGRWITLILGQDAVVLPGGAHFRPSEEALRRHEPPKGPPERAYFVLDLEEDGSDPDPSP